MPTSATWLRLDLQSIDTPVVIAGIYDLTLTAANECTQLPNVARQQSHRAQAEARHPPTEHASGRVTGSRTTGAAAHAPQASLEGIEALPNGTRSVRTART